MSSRDEGHGRRLERTDYPGIFRRGPKYVVIWREHGHQRRRTVRTLAEARELKARMDLGEQRPYSRMRLREYADEWRRTYRGRTGRGIADSTMESYVRALDQHVLPVLGDIRLSDLRPSDVRHLVTRLEESDLSPASVHRYVAPLKTMLQTAVEDGLLIANPAMVVRISRRDRFGREREPARVLNREEIARLRAAVDPEWLIAIDLLLHTGLRVGELSGLQWGDLELDEPARLHVRRQFHRGVLRAPKSRAGRRTIPLAPEMAERLRRRRVLAAYAGDKMPVFATITGSPMDPANLRSRVLRPAVKRAGLQGVGFHTLRHTCASLLVAEGRSIKQVQVWLGHHDAAFTLSTYVHLLDEGVGDAAFLDALTPAGAGDDDA